MHLCINKGPKIKCTYSGKKIGVMYGLKSLMVAEKRSLAEGGVGNDPRKIFPT